MKVRRLLILAAGLWVCVTAAQRPAVGDPPTERPAATAVDLDALATRLNRTVGGNWSKPERQWDIGPHLQCDSLPRTSQTAAFFLFPFPYDESGRARLERQFQRYDAPFYLLGANDRLTVVTYVPRVHWFSQEVVQALNLKQPTGGPGETMVMRGPTSQELFAPGKPLSELIATATAPDAGPREQFLAVRQLAVSPHSPEAAAALEKVACDRGAELGTRQYAAMGLRNFTNALPAKARAAIQDRLRKTLSTEQAETPDDLIRVLLQWGDAAYVHEELGEKLRNHPMEIECLQALPSKENSDRLWELYQTCPREHRAVSYNRLDAIGRALVAHRDERGIDVLVELLAADKDPGRQFRNNVFNYLAATTGKRFGYNHANYHPDLEEATAELLRWWRVNRETFRFQERGAGPNGRKRPRGTDSDGSGLSRKPDFPKRNSNVGNFLNG